MSNRYNFIINYEKKDRNKNVVKNEITVQRGSINNHWFLEADYVIDNLKKIVLKNRYHILSDENVIKAYCL